ncbi:MAG: hypothetical protein ACM359_08235 [Bacillota bacterium]
MKRTAPILLFVLLAACLTSAYAADNAPDILFDAIPRQTLDAMDRRELGTLYTPAIADKLYDAHQLLEKYFAAEKAPDRKAIVTQLAALNLDPNILGRLARIRLYWPQLQPGVYFVNERMGPHPVLYFVGLPDAYDRSKPYPLVIKLPGAHPFVTNPPPTPEQVQALYTGWIQDELKAHPDAVVLMPLLNLNELWGPSYKGVHSVMQSLFHVVGRVNIDPAKVYLTGHAMSAHATWNLAIHYPTFFSAINPLSGSASLPWQRLRLINLRNVPAIVWHDADDKIVPVAASRDLVKILKQYKFDVDYQETQGVGHAPSDEILKTQYAKLRSRVRNLYPKQVSLASNRPDTLLNRNDWVQVYQMLEPGKEKKAIVKQSRSTITLQENSYELTASFTAPNRIEVKCRNVESMRFLLNDQMINFSQPVTVLVNGVVRFQGMLTPNLNDMLNDQLFLGRGWRYYTAAVDVDFGALSSRPTTRPTTRRGTIEYTPK